VDEHSENRAENRADNQHDHRWMLAALELARKARQAGEVPVGAVLVKDGEMIAEGWNQPISTGDPTAHAEIVAIRRACEALGNYRIPGVTLYVSLEPCPMCAGAIVQSRIRRVVYAAPDPGAGAAGTVFNLLDNPSLNHRCEITAGPLEGEASAMLKDFFRDKRVPG
jgi:tRNA(adenine34) deaminase